MSLFKKSSTGKKLGRSVEEAVVEMSVNTVDGSVTTSINGNPINLNNTFAAGMSSNSTISASSLAAYNGAKKPRTASDSRSEAEKEHERLERLSELSSSLENVVADLLPDADKDVPTKIAKAVVDEIFNSGHVLPFLLDAQAYRESQSKLLANFEKMTMEEYAKIRPKLMDGVTK